MIHQIEDLYLAIATQMFIRQSLGHLRQLWKIYVQLMIFLYLGSQNQFHIFNYYKLYLSYSLIQMRSKFSNEYFRGSNDRAIKANSARAVQSRNYDNLRIRLQNNGDDMQHSSNRKHNSPDMNRYRNGDFIRTETNSVINMRGNLQNEEREAGRYQKKYKEDLSSQYNKDYRQVGAREKERDRQGRPRELNRNESVGVLNEKNKMQDQNQDYLKLNQKLNFIESKIAEMKNHVQRKKEQKKAILEAISRRDRERQQERDTQLKEEQRGNGKKFDLKQFVSQVPQHKELHSFSKNPYSPKHDIYYVSEIIKTYKDEQSVGREHLLTSLHILQILQNSRFASEEEMKARQVKLPRREGYAGKKTLVFDLDQTLIHCNDSLTPPYDIKLPITFPTGEVIEAGINIRPHAIEVLRNLSVNFEIIVFTASHSCYANVVLNYLDPRNEFIHHRLFRDHCYQTPQGMYCKDLRVIDREMSDMALVDNAAYSYAAQPDNGIPILPYYHGKNDYELKALEHYLQGMLLLKDVRELNRKTFQLHRYLEYSNDADRLVAELYIKEENQKY